MQKNKQRALLAIHYAVVRIQLCMIQMHTYAWILEENGVINK